MYSEGRDPLRLQFSSYQLLPLIFLGSVRAVTLVIKVKDNQSYKL